MLCRWTRRHYYRSTRLSARSLLGGLTFSMWTSNTFFSETRQVPLHALQRSEAGVLNPVVLHSRHGCWICCIMPGPNGRSIVCRGGHAVMSPRLVM